MWGWGQWKVRSQRFSCVNTADNVVYLASYKGCNYNLLQVQNTMFGWACENGSRITLKGSAGLFFLKHCCYRLAYRNDYRFPRILELEGSSALASSVSPAQKAFSSLLCRQQKRNRRKRRRRRKKRRRKKRRGRKGRRERESTSPSRTNIYWAHTPCWPQD